MIDTIAICFSGLLSTFDMCMLINKKNIIDSLQNFNIIYFFHIWEEDNNIENINKLTKFCDNNKYFMKIEKLPDISYRKI